MSEVFGFIGVDPSVVPSALDRELNRTAPQMHRPRPTLRAISRLPGYRQVARRAPAGLKQVVTRVGKTPVMSDKDQQLTDDLRAELEAKLRDEMRRLRPHLGDDFDCWGLA